MGVNSLPVTLGPERAAKLACIIMACRRVIVIALLLIWSAPYYALAIAVSLALQLASMRVLLRDPEGQSALVQRHGRHPSTCLA